MGIKKVTDFEVDLAQKQLSDLLVFSGVKYLELERKESINIGGGNAEDNNNRCADAINHSMEGANRYNILILKFYS